MAWDFDLHFRCLLFQIVFFLYAEGKKNMSKKMVTVVVFT